jgi:hypothetical protein
MGMDDIERKISYAAGGIALILAIFLLPHLLHDTTVTDSAKLNARHLCPTGYHVVSGACQRARLTHPSSWIPQFAEIIVFGAVLVLFAKRSKRSGVAVCALPRTRTRHHRAPLPLSGRMAHYPRSAPAKIR